MKRLLFFILFTFSVFGAKGIFAQQEWDGIVRYGVDIQCDYPDGIEPVCQVFNNGTDLNLRYPLCNVVDSVEAGTEHWQYVIFTRQTTVDTIYLDGMAVWSSTDGLNWEVAGSADHQWDIMYFFDGDHFVSVQDGHGADCIWIYFRNINADHSIRVVHSDIPYLKNTVSITCTYEDGYDAISGRYDDTVYSANCIFDAAGDRPLSNTIDSAMRNKALEYYVLLDDEKVNSVRIDGNEVWSREGGLNYAAAQESDEETQTILMLNYYTLSLSEDGSRLTISFRCHMSPQINILYGRDDAPLAISDVDSPVALSLMPNPSGSSVLLSVAGAEGATAYRLIDMSGRMALSGRLGADGQARIDVSHLAKGPYVLHLVGERVFGTEKLIVR